jgi:pimeloyl-ACP methyl ester carboxylesterase
VLILPSNGPTDRNGNNAFGIRGEPYRLLAEALAARGITSLRVDKRGYPPGLGDDALRRRTYGFAASTVAEPGEPPITVDSYAADARAWAAALKARLGVRCVWLLGHGEGGLHALLAAQGNGDVCGVILLAVPGRRAGEIIRAGAPGAAEIDRILDQLEAGRTVPDDNFSRPLMTLFPPAAQPYIISLLRVDPAALVRRYRRPVLVVHGSTDVQIDPGDARRLGEARRGVTLRIIEGMNHALKPAPPERDANMAVYSDPNVGLAPGLVEAVADFIEAN